MERKKVIQVALITVGVIILLAGITYAYNWGLFNPSPLGDRPLNEEGKAAKPVTIYCQAQLNWHRLAVAINSATGWAPWLYPNSPTAWLSTAIPHHTALTVEDVQCSQTRAYTMSVSQLLWFGSGNIDCRADLVDAKGNTIYSAANPNLPPLGNIGWTNIPGGREPEPLEEKWNFALNGWEEQKYTINVQCYDKDNPEDNWDSFILEYETL